MEGLERPFDPKEKEVVKKVETFITHHLKPWGYTMEGLERLSNQGKRKRKKKFQLL